MDKGGFALRLLDADQRDPWGKDEDHLRPGLSAAHFPRHSDCQIPPEV